MVIKIRNFDKFQHFKDRTPPWVKLYRDILDDPDWFELDPVAAKMLVMLWLIASEDETKQGSLPCNKKLAFRLRISEKQLEQTLTKLSHWLIHDDINVISERYQLDAPETETETETDSVSNEKIVFDGSSFQNVEKFLPTWKSAYPALDIPGELAKAAAWLVANPKNKKSQYGRFLNGWLSRAQDRAPRHQSPSNDMWAGVSYGA